MKAIPHHHDPYALPPLHNTATPDRFGRLQFPNGWCCHRRESSAHLVLCTPQSVVHAILLNGVVFAPWTLISSVAKTPNSVTRHRRPDLSSHRNDNEQLPVPSRSRRIGSPNAYSLMRHVRIFASLCGQGGFLIKAFPQLGVHAKTVAPPRRRRRLPRRAMTIAPPRRRICLPI